MGAQHYPWHSHLPLGPINLWSIALSGLRPPFPGMCPALLHLHTCLASPPSHLGEEVHIPSSYALTKSASSHLHSKIILFISPSLHFSSYFGCILSLMLKQARHSSNQLTNVSPVSGTMLGARFTAVNRRFLPLCSPSSRDY